jgi:hypothetical protein
MECVEQQPVTYSQLEVRQVESALHNCFTFLRLRDSWESNSEPQVGTPHWGGKQVQCRRQRVAGKRAGWQWCKGQASRSGERDAW